MTELGDAIHEGSALCRTGGGCSDGHLWDIQPNCKWIEWRRWSGVELGHTAHYGWGQAYLGNGQQSTSPVPVSIRGLSGATSVSTSDNESVALMGNGTVETWGSNDSGQLGVGSMAPSKSLVPIHVPGLSNVKAVSARSGIASELALLSNGTVEAWGENLGALGDGIAGPSPPLTDDSPQPVVGLTGVTAISGGPEDSLALLNDGTVMIWGGFDAEATPGHNRPVPMEALSGVKAVSAASLHNLALLKNGTVVSWGDPGCTCDAQPGTGANTPAPMKGLSNVVAISAGQGLDLALLKTGTVMEWSVNNPPRIGDGSDAEMGSPHPVKGLSGVTAISAGASFGIALVDDGSVHIWAGGSQVDKYSPIGRTLQPGADPHSVKGIVNVKWIAAGIDSFYAGQAKPGSASPASPIKPTFAAVERAACFELAPHDSEGDRCAIHSMRVSTVSPDWVLVQGLGYYSGTDQPPRIQEARSDLDEAILNLRTHRLIGPTNIGFCHVAGTNVSGPDLSAVPSAVILAWGLQPCTNGTPTTVTTVVPSTTPPVATPTPPPSVSTQPTPGVTDFSQWSGSWGAHEQELAVSPTGAGQFELSRPHNCPNCSFGGAPTSTMDFQLTSVNGTTASGTVTQSSDTANYAVGQDVTVSLAPGSPGQLLELSVAGQGADTFCNSTSAGQCGA